MVSMVRDRRARCQRGPDRAPDKRTATVVHARVARLTGAPAVLWRWARVVGDIADPALWVMLVGSGVAALVARHATGAAPLPEVGAGVAARPFAGGLLWGGSLGVLALAVLLAPGGRARPFIYFQF